MSEQDTRWMRRALELAARAAGRTAPNPVVGAVIVRDERVVGEGWHERAGAPHAEAVALAAAGDRARGAELYVTLEPCAHTGRTPPCAPAVARAGIRRVVAAIEDPDPRVQGQGLACLREAGVAVETGLLAAAAVRLNEPYLHRVATGRAFGVLKAAITLDGQLAADGGDSRWITAEPARVRAHELRDTYDAVLIGRGTLEADDPSLNVRLPGEHRDPVAVVLDTHLTAPAERRLFTRAAAGAGVLVAASPEAPAERRAALERQGVTVAPIAPGPDGRVDLVALFADLASRGLNSVMVEGGGTVHTSCLAAGLVSRVHVFVAPRLLGGARGLHWIGDLGARRVADALDLEDVEHEVLGPDLLITGRLAGDPRAPQRPIARAAAVKEA